MIAALTALLLAAPTGTLTLDRADPVVSATIDGVPLRLRVALDQHAVVELNPDAAARLPSLEFERDGGAQVGRIAIPGRVARARLIVAGRKVDVTASSYPRPCCANVDGEIAPDLLPFAELHFTSPAPATRTRTVNFAMERSEDLGLFTRARTPGGPVLLLFTLNHAATLATGAGAAVLARGGAGRFTATTGTETRAFGIPRPVRTMILDRPVTIAGFTVASLSVRTADFRGDNALPPIPGSAEPAADIRVTARAPAPQRAIPAVTFGRDLLDACPDIRFAVPTRRLTLTCTLP
ncbi:hypothetical protein ACFSGX_01755 [Sphingomonas arantia]|uniref:Uncharacterized protein n=1 Tax=Sphingomonas arantia TaxID=1460676 RepID=A0ABW4TS54_9SPHN